jgi:hypothetical protein
MARDYVQYLAPEILKSLKSGALNPLLNLLHGDPELALGIHKGDCTIYYLGSCFCHISESGGLQINKNYAKLERGKPDINKEKCDFLDDLNKKGRQKQSKEAAEAWVRGAKKIKHIIKENRERVAPNKERQKQQWLLSANNNFATEFVFFEQEYGVRVGSRAEVDLVGAVVNAHGTFDIVLLELKVGHKTMNGKKASIADHINDFERIKTERKADLLESVKKIFAIKKELGLLRNCPDELNLSEAIKYVVLAYGLETKGQIEKWERLTKSHKGKPGLWCRRSENDKNKLSKEWLFSNS